VKDSDITFLSIEDVLSLHSLVISTSGGLSGLRDVTILGSAVAKPQNFLIYEKCNDIFRLAAILGCAIIKNHPFNDGNKRVGLLASCVMLRVNHAWGPIKLADVNICYEIIISVAAGEMHETELALFLRKCANDF
jgi:death-on-curing protein